MIMKGLIFTTSFVIGLLILAALLLVLERLLRRWRLGFLLIFPGGSFLAFLVATTATGLAGTPDWTFLVSISIAQGLVALITIRAAMSAGRRWKASDRTQSNHNPSL